MFRLKTGRLGFADEGELLVLARLHAPCLLFDVFRFQMSNLLMQGLEMSAIKAANLRTVAEYRRSKLWNIDHLNWSKVEHLGKDNPPLLHLSHLVLQPTLLEILRLTQDWKL